MSYQRPTRYTQIPEKANRVLHVIFFMLALIMIRIWHLTVIQYDAKLEESKKPQQRTLIEPAKRGTIRDRYNFPLAINAMQYNATILYSQLKSIPSIKWVTNADGTRTKIFKRKEYIKALSHLIAEELQLDPERLEDLIHAKAALYYNIPYVIKEDISEKEYYRLKMLEKDWVGIQVQKLPKRVYPKGRVAADIIGYMGAINRTEYEKVMSEIRQLEHYFEAAEQGANLEPLPSSFQNEADAQKRLTTLRQLAYSLNDYVGKTGIEAQFEELLRGINGKKRYYSDARGNFLRELPDSTEPLPGKKIVLTISSELQEYAEHLLIQNERIREAKISYSELASDCDNEKQPWIKGGAILAMDPHTGEILALASYPRFDPNDFTPSANPETHRIKNLNIARWFENENYLSQIWDQKRPLERERFNDRTEEPFEEKVHLTWEKYLAFLLPPDSKVLKSLANISSIEKAVQFERDLEFLFQLGTSCSACLYDILNVLYEDEGHPSYGKKMSNEMRQAIESTLTLHHEGALAVKERLYPYFHELTSHYDKVLLADLCKLLIDPALFSNHLIEAIGRESLSDHRSHSAAFANLEPAIKNLIKPLFHAIDFKLWRKEHEKPFLKSKREEETRLLRYPKPYIDYLDQMESDLFSTFWAAHRADFMKAFLLGKHSGRTEAQEYETELIQWHQEIIAGAHALLPWKDAYFQLYSALNKLPPPLIIPYLNTLRTYEDLTRPLFGYYPKLRKDKALNYQLEKHLASAFYPVHGFGYGRSHAFRQSTTQGSLFKLITTYAGLLQRYEEIKDKKITPEMMNPLEMTDHVQKHGQSWTVGYHKDGTPIPQLYKGGKIPKSQIKNIGSLNIVKAIETSSNTYFALLASEYMHHPQQLIDAAMAFSYGKKTGIDLPGEIAGKIPTDIESNRSGLYALTIGQHSLVVSPLQTSVMLSAIANGGKIMKPQVVKKTIGINKEPLVQEDLNDVMAGSVQKTPQPELENLYTPEIRSIITMPNEVRNILLEGMQRVIERMQKHAISGLSRFYHDYPEAISDYLDLEGQLIGKTSTAESMETIDLDRQHGTNKYTHVWFGGIAYANEKNDSFVALDPLGHPELVVVVYLRFGRFGKEAAPLAAQMIKKWREIKTKNDQLERNGVEPLASTMPLLRSTS